MVALTGRRCSEPTPVFKGAHRCAVTHGSLSFPSGQHADLEHVVRDVYLFCHGRVATPVCVLSWDARAVIAAYLQVIAAFLRNPVLPIGPRSVANVLLAHIDPFQPDLPVQPSLPEIAAQSCVSRAQVCVHLRDLERRCARCFDYLEGACACRKKQPMIVRMPTKGHSNSKYKILFAHHVLQKHDQSENQTVTVRKPDGHSLESGPL